MRPCATSARRKHVPSAGRDLAGTRYVLDVPRGRRILQVFRKHSLSNEPLKSIDSLEPATSATRRDVAAIVFALTFPTLVTLVYFIGLAESAAGWQLAAKAIGIVIQIGFPLFWLICVQKQRLSRARPQRDGVLIGGMLGLAIVAAMFAAYQFWLKPNGAFDAAATSIREKVIGLGIDSTAKFAALGVFYAVLHSLLEEYYWRLVRVRPVTPRDGARPRDRNLGRRLHGPSCDRAVGLLRLGFVLQPVLVAECRCRRRDLGLALRPQSIALRPVAESCAGRCGNFPGRIRDREIGVVICQNTQRVRPIHTVPTRQRACVSQAVPDGLETRPYILECARQKLNDRGLWSNHGDH